MYSLFTSPFEKINLNQNVNYHLGVLKEKYRNLCKGVAVSEKIFEAFQDNMEKEAIAAGPIFCDSLNGKLIAFPKTLEELDK